MNEINLNDEYGYTNYKYLKEVLSYALEKENIKNAIFSVIFCDDEYIQKLNQKHRGIDKVTDVISFAIEDNAKIVYNDIRVLGDIFISIPQMKRQAIEYSHSEKRELSFLAVHGLLHLLGYDHKTTEDEKIMNALQEVILNDKNIKR